MDPMEELRVQGETDKENGFHLDQVIDHLKVVAKRLKLKSRDGRPTDADAAMVAKQVFNR